MKIGENELNSFQVNFLKELMGETFMSDTRLSSRFQTICGKNEVDQKALLEAVNKNFAAKVKEIESDVSAKTKQAS